MICITDAKQTLELEKQAVAKQKITIEQLMDSAGKALAELACSLPSREGKHRIAIVCGKGNNAGDGFVATRYLSENKIEVKALMLYEPSELSADAKNAYEKLPKDLIATWEKGAPFLEKAQIIIDAIFGFSFCPPLKSYEKSIIEKINNSNAYVISADVPSGIEASTGQIAENLAIKADMTVSFSCIKKGLLDNLGPDYAGLIKAVNIGIKKDLSQQYAQYLALDIYEAKKLLPIKKPLDHKKTKGKVLVVAGSSAFTGAAILTAEAALRSGAGYVILAVPETIKSLVQEKITPEIIVKGLNSTSEGTLALAAKKEIIDLSKDFDCLAIGPGLTTQKKTAQLVTTLLKELTIPMVIDADALNVLASGKWEVGSGKGLLDKIKTEVVLTPHAGELSRLTGMPVDDIEKDRFNAAKKLVSDNITVLLKGRYSIIASKEKTFVNLTSNPAMATAGTGDVLIGVIASLFAQGLKPAEAATLGAYIHGLAGDIAATELSEYSVIATDLIDCLPYAFGRIVKLQETNFK